MTEKNELRLADKAQVELLRQKYCPESEENENALTRSHFGQEYRLLFKALDSADAESAQLRENVFDCISFVSMIRYALSEDISWTDEKLGKTLGEGVVESIVQRTLKSVEKEIGLVNAKDTQRLKGIETLLVQSIKQEGLSPKQYFMERLKSQANVAGAKSELQSDLSTDTTMTIQSLMLLNGFVLRVMDLFTEKLELALIPQKDKK